jgi:hypothetical protein
VQPPEAVTLWRDYAARWRSGQSPRRRRQRPGDQPQGPHQEGDGSDGRPVAIIAEIRASGATSLGRIAKALNERGIRTPRGAAWQAVQVKRVLEAMATEVKA